MTTDSGMRMHCAISLDRVIVGSCQPLTVTHICTSGRMPGGCLCYTNTVDFMLTWMLAHFARWMN